MLMKFILKTGAQSITANGKTISLPVLIIPGTNANTVGIAVGYGRSKENGKKQQLGLPECLSFASFNGTTVFLALLT